MQSVQQTALQATQTAREASAHMKTVETSLNTKVDAIDRASSKLSYEVLLTDDDATFNVGQTELSDPAKASLAGLVNRLKQEPANVYLAIEGHTDSTGPSSANDRIGLERAEAVERYLYEQYLIPPSKMDVMSYE